MSIRGGTFFIIYNSSCNPLLCILDHGAVGLHAYPYAVEILASSPSIVNRWTFTSCNSDQVYNRGIFMDFMIFIDELTYARLCHA